MNSLCPFRLQKKVLNELAPFKSKSFPNVSLKLERTMTSSIQGHHHATVPYSPPKWAENLSNVPKERVVLGLLPTPLHKWNVPNLPSNIELWVKRDDLTEMQMSGNKTRKLEFLLAAARAAGHDCLITIGGIQSNHARATAVAASYFGLPCHLILRTGRHLVDQDPGLAGNLLLDRLSGAKIHLVTKEEYQRHGSAGLLAALEAQLVAAGHRPFVIPVGGSNAVGAWGYIEAIREMSASVKELGITDVVMACGSGGTASGLALANRLSGLNLKVHAYGVCDDPPYFYRHVAATCTELGFPCVYGGEESASHGSEAANTPVATGARLPEGVEGGEAVDVRDLIRCVQARGTGYAMSTAAELETITNVARATGVVLDPVYSGKAFHNFLREVADNPSEWNGKKILFIHTGGLLGLYDKADQLHELLSCGVSRLNL